MKGSGVRTTVPNDIERSIYQQYPQNYIWISYDQYKVMRKVDRLSYYGEWVIPKILNKNIKIL